MGTVSNDKEEDAAYLVAVSASPMGQNVQTCALPYLDRVLGIGAQRLNEIDFNADVVQFNRYGWTIKSRIHSFVSGSCIIYGPGC